MLLSEDIKSKIVELAEHDLRLQSIMIAFNENLKQINENVRHVTESSIKLAERIKVLESDMQERSFKKQIMSALMTLYPLIIIALVIMTNLDHNKIKNLMDSLHAVVQFNE
jgi:hypothetical protein